MEATLQTWNPLAGVARRPAAARRAVGTLFFLNGALFATWVSRVPTLQGEHALGDGALGLALLAVAAGAILAMPLAGLLSGRRGSGTVCKVSGSLYFAALPALALAPGLPLFIAALFFFGASHGALDVAMNAQAVSVERRYPKPIMSSFHALFSTGGLVGALLGSLAAGWGLAPVAHFGLAALVLGGIGFLLFPHLLHVLEQERLAHPAPKTKKSGSPFRFLKGSLLGLGAVALCTMMGEGAIADWSAVYLRNHLHSSESLAAAGYAAFSIAMAAGRFGGDYLSARFDPVVLVRTSGLVAAVGLLVALVMGNSRAALFGFACVGAGLSTVVPLVFSAAGRLTNGSPGMAVASVTTLGYFGFLAGPPLIGMVAEFLTLRLALGLIVGTSLVIVALASATREPGTTAEELKVMGDR